MQAVVLEDGNDVVQSDIPEKDLASKSVTNTKKRRNIFFRHFTFSGRRGRCFTHTFTHFSPHFHLGNRFSKAFLSKAIHFTSSSLFVIRSASHPFSFHMPSHRGSSSFSCQTSSSVSKEPIHHEPEIVALNGELL